MSVFLKKLIVIGGAAFVFVLPFFGHLAAEPVSFHDEKTGFSILVPDGWKTDDSGHMGEGVILKGSSGTAGLEPAVVLTHELTGIVTLDVMWHTRLGQIRYDLTWVQFRSLEDHEASDPPHYQATYSYRDGDISFLALIRMVHHGDRFFQMSAAAPEGEFEALRPLFISTFDSLKFDQGS
jgi:hypothetical protein